jgi:hypothetical protein
MTDIKEMKNHFLQSDNLMGLWIDALAIDQETQLLFLSAWGSETVVQNCRARFSLPVSEGGLRRFRLDDGPSRWTSVQVRVDQAERYEQLTGRPSGQSRFLHLTHLWMFPRLALQPDSANCTALLFQRPAETQGGWETRLWQAVQTVCPVPLHPSWRSVMAWFTQQGWVSHHRGFQVNACSLRFPEKEVQALITQGIRSGHLTLPTVH